MHARTPTQIHNTRTHTHAHARTHERTRTRARTHTHGRTDGRMHAQTHACTHPCDQSCMRTGACMPLYCRCQLLLPSLEPNRMYCHLWQCWCPDHHSDMHELSRSSSECLLVQQLRNKQHSLPCSPSVYVGTNSQESYTHVYTHVCTYLHTHVYTQAHCHQQP